MRQGVRRLGRGRSEDRAARRRFDAADGALPERRAEPGGERRVSVSEREQARRDARFDEGRRPAAHPRSGGERRRFRRGRPARRSRAAWDRLRDYGGAEPAARPRLRDAVRQRGGVPRLEGRRARGVAHGRHGMGNAGVFRDESKRTPAAERARDAGDAVRRLGGRGGRDVRHSPPRRLRRRAGSRRVDDGRGVKPRSRQLRHVLIRHIAPAGEPRKGLLPVDMGVRGRLGVHDVPARPLVGGAEARDGRSGVGAKRGLRYAGRQARQFGRGGARRGGVGERADAGGDLRHASGRGHPLLPRADGGRSGGVRTLSRARVLRRARPPRRRRVRSAGGPHTILRHALGAPAGSAGARRA